MVPDPLVPRDTDQVRCSFQPLPGVFLLSCLSQVLPVYGLVFASPGGGCDGEEGCS